MIRIMMYAFAFMSFFVGMTSCNNSAPKAGGATVDLNLYTVEKIDGSTWKKVSRNHETGAIFEEGYVNNGMKVGTWTTYYPENGYIQTITSFDDGVFTGPFIEFDERGRLMKQANYANNQLSGLYGEFKNGRPEKKIMYKNGLVNGFIREYNVKSQLIKESNYKNNVLDGTVRNYNEEGKVVLEYIYKNGEKLSGGIVE